MEWMILPYRRYADFTGRSTRTEYWLFQLFQVICYVVCFIVVLAGIPWTETGPDAKPGAMFWLGFGMMAVFWLGTFIPDVAVCVRRFHDQDQSGWMYFIGWIPYIGWVVRLVFMCIEGTRGDNRFGHDPKGTGAADVFA